MQPDKSMPRLEVLPRLPLLHDHTLIHSNSFTHSLTHSLTLLKACDLLDESVDANVIGWVPLVQKVELVGTV
jgi:hypothetical protein